MAAQPVPAGYRRPGILTLTFANLLLPDSNVNETASHGFIQFSIDQRPDNPSGLLLENRAGIYFDFNAPVMTNTVFHTIGHDFLPSATREPGTAIPWLQVWPNPASQTTHIWAENLSGQASDWCCATHWAASCGKWRCPARHWK